MLTVLIADDEKKVGELIKELVEWESLNLSLVSVVQDGQIAFELIREKMPDIVITDIRMPNLTGLELIKNVKDLNLGTRFIVISGYRYFEYAQTALKYGVEDYLLKPIDEIELNKILQKICSEEMQKRRNDIQVQSLQKKYRDSKHILHRELMERIFVNSEEHEVAEINKEYGVNLEDGAFWAIGVKVDRNLNVEKEIRQEKLILRKLSDMLTENFEDKVNDLVISEKPSMTILLLLNYEEHKAIEIRESINELFQQMKNYINDFEFYDITLGLGVETFEFSQVNIGLEIAKEALDCRILEGTGKCISNYSNERNQKIKAQDIIDEHRDQIEKNIHIVDVPGLKDGVQMCFRKARLQKIMASEFYELARRLLGEYCELVSELFDEDMKRTYVNWIEESGHCKTISSLEQYVCKVFEQRISFLKSKRREQERKPIQEVVEFIKQNFNEKILLEDLAEKTGFNSNYFSEIFKNETGKTFSTYLLEVRMAEAKILLRDSSEPIYEVALKVGYKDSKFFSKQFTKVVGIKPTEYRKLYY